MADGTWVRPINSNVITETVVGEIIYGPIVPGSAESIASVFNPTMIFGSIVVIPEAAIVNVVRINPNALGGVPAGATGESKSFFKF